MARGNGKVDKLCYEFVCQKWHQGCGFVNFHRFFLNCLFLFFAFGTNLCSHELQEQQTPLLESQNSRGFFLFFCPVALFLLFNPNFREDEHFSDPDLQRTQKKYASCAKSLAERTAFKVFFFYSPLRKIVFFLLINLNQMGEESNIRVSAICPSAVLGPRLSGADPSDFVVRLLTGERKWEKCPNGSMSFVDVRDLAALHVGALENENAKGLFSQKVNIAHPNPFFLLFFFAGRFFGVCENSLHFEDIAKLLKDNWPTLEIPPPLEEERVRGKNFTSQVLFSFLFFLTQPFFPVTHFDFTKQKTLGVECRPASEVLKQYIEWMVSTGFLKKE